jgi:hypothetical protein
MNPEHSLIVELEDAIESGSKDKRVDAHCVALGYRTVEF